jgi:hypothetical protein
MVTFRKAIRHYAVKVGLEFAKGIRTDKTRYIARCAAEGCLWRIHASKIYDDRTIEVLSCLCSYHVFAIFINRL